MYKMDMVDDMITFKLYIIDSLLQNNIQLHDSTCYLVYTIIMSLLDSRLFYNTRPYKAIGPIYQQTYYLQTDCNTFGHTNSYNNKAGYQLRSLKMLKDDRLHLYFQHHQPLCPISLMYSKMYESIMYIKPSVLCASASFAK